MVTDPLPVIIVYGDAQAAAVGVILAADRAIGANFAVEYFSIHDEPATDGRDERLNVLPRAALLLEQKSWAPFPFRDRLRPECDVLTFAALDFGLLWPLRCANDLNSAPSERHPWGLFPIGDKVILACAKRGMSVDETWQYYVDHAGDELGAVAALRNSELLKLSARDAECDVPIADFIAANLSAEPLFWAPQLPNVLLLSEMCKRIIARAARSLPCAAAVDIDAALRTLPAEGPLGLLCVPIHPRVADALSLTWVKRDDEARFGYLTEPVSYEAYFRHMAATAIAVRNDRASVAATIEPAADAAGAQYAATIEGTKKFFNDVDVHALPPIFAYWAVKHITPLWQELGVSDTTDLFARYLLESARRSAAGVPRFASIGAGVCGVEVAVARRLKDDGLPAFTIDCLELNAELLAIGRAAAEAAGVTEHLRFIEADLNTWAAADAYNGIMVNHSLHHVVNLESLFSAIEAALMPGAYFVIADMIGRNGHMRWPEALVHVHRFWDELPASYRFNRLLNRHEDRYENWDCSNVAFEGIRAQDILPLLIERFHFVKFCAYGNVVDVFVDRCFGHNFNADGEWDRRFIDRVHAFDERSILAGELTPAQMLAVVTKEAVEDAQFVRGLSPQQAVRRPGT